MTESFPSAEREHYPSIFPWGSLDVSREAVDKFGLSPYMVTTSGMEQPSLEPTRSSIPKIHISIDTTESFERIPLPNDDENNLFIPVTFSRKDPADLNRVLKLGKPGDYEFLRSTDEWDVRTAHALGLSAGEAVSKSLLQRLRATSDTVYDRRAKIDKSIIGTGAGLAAVEAFIHIDDLESRMVPAALVVGGIAKLISDRRDRSAAEIELIRKSNVWALRVQQDIHATICKGHAIGSLEQKFKES